MPFEFWRGFYAGHHCDTSSKHSSVTLNSSGLTISPSSGPVAPFCPTYRTSEITPLPVDLLSHRAFSTVIPDSSHSCGAKIDRHPYAFGSAKPIPYYDSAPLISHAPPPQKCVKPSKSNPFNRNCAALPNWYITSFFPLQVWCKVYTVCL